MTLGHHGHRNGPGGWGIIIAFGIAGYIAIGIGIFRWLKGY